MQHAFRVSCAVWRRVCVLPRAEHGFQGLGSAGRVPGQVAGWGIVRADSFSIARHVAIDTGRRLDLARGVWSTVLSTRHAPIKTPLRGRFWVAKEQIETKPPVTAID